jgi:enamine deaminase RidA (YjgF/YER057c/UK114 family)
MSATALQNSTMLEPMKSPSDLALPNPSSAQGLYVTVAVYGDIAYVSGQLPRLNNELQYRGKVGREISIEDARDAARLCACQCLSVLEKEIGSLDKVARLLKVTGFVCSVDGFTEQAKVMDAASALFREVLGERGLHARSSVGVAELPRGAPVEIEIIVALVPSH